MKDPKSNPTNKKASFQTEMIHGENISEAWDFTKPLIPPISASTTFRLGSVERGAEGFLSFASEDFKKNPIWIYDRLDEPNTLMLESQLAKAELAEAAITFGSGMGAIASSFFAFCKSDDEIICHKTIYGCTYSLFKNWLPKMGIKTHFMDLTKDFKNSINANTRVIYFESVSNPSLEVIDIKNISKMVKEINKDRPKGRQLLVIVDNTFPTPCGCLPIALGADVVVHSLTKNISGFGTEMGGVVVTRKEFEPLLKIARKDFGAVMHPRAAWDINVHGLPTLNLRFEEQQRNANLVATYLEQHAKVKFVSYPGLESFAFHDIAKQTLVNRNGEFSPGYMLAFELNDPETLTTKFVNTIAKDSYSITLAVSLGLTKTLIELPNFMTHSALDDTHKKNFSVSPYLIRMSIGLEDPLDIINDIEMALL